MHILHNSKISNILQDISDCNTNTFFIIDSNLKGYFHLFEGYNTIKIESSEQNKTLSTVEKIANELLQRGADRDALLVGVGGGITTDITGFVASIYKRGVKCAFIPTTLLAQVDASIGGKNGVNFNSYKNILGTITQPQKIYLCAEVLKTLPDNEFKAGIAEVLKTFILFDKEYYKIAVEYFSNVAKKYAEESGRVYGEVALEVDAEILLKIISKCAEYKSGVVQRDEFERGERRLLNLGHTFAHSIEKLTEGIGVSHGYAVSMGMVIAAKIADKMGVSQKGFTQKLTEDLKSVGLPALLEDCPQTAHLKISDLVDAVKKDKKVTGSNIHFILPKGVVDVEDITIALDKIKELANGLC